MLVSLVEKIRNAGDNSRYFMIFRRGISPRLFKVMLMAAMATVLASILSVQFMPDRSISTLVVGDKSPKEIRAPRSGRYADDQDLAERRQRAADAVPAVYDTDRSALPDAIADAQSVYDAVIDVRSHARDSLSNQEMTAAVEKRLSFKLASSSIKLLLNTDTEALKRLERQSIYTIKNTMSQGIRDNTLDLQVARSIALQHLKDTNLQQRYVGVVSDVLQGAIRPNRLYNSEKTKALRLQEMEKVRPVYKTVAMNEIILDADETVNARHIAMLMAVGLFQGEINYLTLAGLLFFVLLSIGLVAYYIYNYHPAICDSPGALLLICVLSATGMLFAWLLSPVLSGYVSLLPVLTTIMIVAIIFDSSLAMLLTAFFGISLGLMMGGQIHFTVITIISGSTAVFSVRKIFKNGDLVQAGFIVGLAGFLSILSVSLLNGEPIANIGINTLFGMVSGVGAAIAVIGGLSFLEKPFGLTTHIHLLELCNPTEPLLKRLLTEAPGTYHHSIIVGNLAEAAAEIVGADPLLTRVGAYYHDIGKAKRPYFFVENQVNHENAHEKLSPHLSILVIMAHVRDGIDMARQYRLPERVIDIIAQHHGTSLILFFYHQAIAQEKDHSLTENQFRYAGPRPCSRESALIMLADSVEAAVRSMTKPSPNKVEALVRKIIKDKLSDGQLDDSDLTFKDLSRIADTFIRVLSGIYHPRIEYPETPDIRHMHAGGRRRLGAVK